MLEDLFKSACVRRKNRKNVLCSKRRFIGVCVAFEESLSSLIFNVYPLDQGDETKMNAEDEAKYSYRLFRTKCQKTDKRFKWRLNGV